MCWVKIENNNNPKTTTFFCVYFLMSHWSLLTGCADVQSRGWRWRREFLLHWWADWPDLPAAAAVSQSDRSLQCECFWSVGFSCCIRASVWSLGIETCHAVRVKPNQILQKCTITLYITLFPSCLPPSLLSISFSRTLSLALILLQSHSLFLLHSFFLSHSPSLSVHKICNLGGEGGGGNCT